MWFNQTVLPQSGRILTTVQTDIPNMTYVVWFGPDGNVLSFTNYYGELYGTVQTTSSHS